MSNIEIWTSVISVLRYKMPVVGLGYNINSSSVNSSIPTGVPSWVISIVFVLTPEPEIVTVAILVSGTGFFSAVNVIVVFPDPETVLTDNQFLLQAILQLIFEVMLNVLLLFAWAKMVKAFVETFNEGSDASWVTVIVFEVTPDPDTVIVELLVDVDGLDAAVNVMVALPVPDALLTVNQP